MIQKPKSKVGFTLLEVLVSITILALMALMVSRIFSESSRAVERGKDLAFLDETARSVLDHIEQDLSQALIRTNVAFRIQTLIDPNDSVYFISTGARRQFKSIPRDTAPIRIQTAQTSPDPEWNLFIEIQSPENSPDHIKNAIRYSDYYFTDPNQVSSDFFQIHDTTSKIELQNSRSTQPLEQDWASHAVLTFMEFSANANRSSNNNNSNGQPDPADMPHFVDVTIGVISSMDLQLAIDRNSQQHIEKNESIYTRRIFMRNQGIDQLTF
jgi:prepilin-type N-terminal cleavage/methylation domain-containing protein